MNRGKNFITPSMCIKENPSTFNQRGHTTILFGGLTWKHEVLLKGALECLGYRCENLPTPNLKAFQIGKEYGNNGQCNPAYFTVGNLIQYLRSLVEQGLSKREIIGNYVFLTAGSCGPCRFGMYEAEYRLALRNSGFGEFRVLLFQQSGCFDQTESKTGLEMNIDFFLSILNALIIADVVNEFAHQLRPYEISKGETDRILDETVHYLHGIISGKKHFKINEEMTNWLRYIRMDGVGEYILKFLAQLFGQEYTRALRHVSERFNSIEIDRFQVRPVVKITGEFWAQTVEGDGNFNMFRFLEKEGAEVLVNPVADWISYLIHKAKQAIHDRKGLGGKDESAPGRWELKKWLAYNIRFRKKEATLVLAESVFRREYNRLIKALGGTCNSLADQDELERLAHPFFNSRSSGGEGHLEVAKNIYYTAKKLAHMVLSLKPFGCMPSTQSDGAQAAVVSAYRDMIFLPIETSGEGEINAHSRVQMALGEARSKAKNEFNTILKQTGFTLNELKTHVEKHPEMKKPLYHVPHYRGIIGRGACFVKHVAEKIRTEYSKSGGKKKTLEHI